MAAGPIGRRPPKTRSPRGERTKSTLFAVAFALFLALAAAAILAGGHSLIGPLLQSSGTAGEAQRGDVVIAMPEGDFCRRLSFDNATAELSGGGVEPCPHDLRRGRANASPGFAWGRQ